MATAAEEQTATTSEISNNMQIAEAVSQTSGGAQETAWAAEHLSGLADNPRSIVGQFKLS